ncbi:putative TMEM14 family protein [Helianthus annuus]|nr:putative TMEM14 family protein [Helianthus annuus]
MVSTADLLAISQSSILLPQFRSQVSTQGQNRTPCYKVCTTASTSCTRGGGDVGGGEGNNWGGSGGGEGSSDDSEKEPKKMAMSMSQKLTLGYAALVGLGGLMGYLKSGSQKSLLSGGISAALLYYVYTQLPVNPVFASCVGFGLSAALLGVMGTRFKKSGKVFPAGVVSVVSLVMTGGYIHGIMRSFH